MIDHGWCGRCGWHDEWHYADGRCPVGIGGRTEMASAVIRCARCKGSMRHDNWIRLSETIMAPGKGYVDRVEVVEEIDLCLSCAEAVTGAIAASIDNYGKGRARKAGG